MLGHIRAPEFFSNVLGKNEKWGKAAVPVAPLIPTGVKISVLDVSLSF